MSGSWADDLARAGESAWAAKGEPVTVREGAAPVSREGQEPAGESEAIQAAGYAIAEMFPGLGPETGRKIAAAVLDAARPHLTRAAFYLEGVKAERERIADMADRLAATVPVRKGSMPFGEVIRGQP